MHGMRLHKTSRRDAMARDPSQDLLSRDRDASVRDRDIEDFVQDETLVCLETVLRPRRLDRDHIPGNMCTKLHHQLVLKQLCWVV